LIQASKRVSVPSSTLLLENQQARSSGEEFSLRQLKVCLSWDGGPRKMGARKQERQNRRAASSREQMGEKKQVLKTRRSDVPMGVGDAVLTMSERGRGD
jgi:hypothetical protein